MTEAEWLAATDPGPILEFVRGKASDRKLRLFVVQLCWRGSQLFSRPELVRAAEVAEQFVDGLASEEELAAESDLVSQYCWSSTPEHGPANSADLALEWVSDLRRGSDFARHAADCLLSEAVIFATRRHRQALEAADPRPEIEYPAGEESVLELSAWFRRINEAEEAYCIAVEGAELTAQAHCLRDIFGNPFRPISLDPAWRTSTVVALAEGIYADRAFDRLPILADALQEAGCDHPEVLAHCRGDGPHARGCWVVDLVLGKA